MPASTPTSPAKPGNYEIPRPAGACTVSGKVIAPDEKFIAAVRETPAGFERVDVSTEHWEQFDKSSLLGFWQATMPHLQQKRKVFVDDEVLCSLFERLADASEPAKVNFRFVLGLILMRKRLLVYETTRHDAGHDVWVVRLRGKEQKLDLLDPKLDETQVSDVSQQLHQILNDEL